MTKAIAWIKAHRGAAAAIAAALVIAALAAAVKLGRLAPGPEARKISASDLYTGREAKGKVGVLFASRTKPMPMREDREIYLSDSVNARARQAVNALLEGPQGADLVRVFPAGVTLANLFIDKGGLCVVDLSAAASSGFAGGTTGEYLALYCLTHTLTDNFAGIQRVQVMVGGQRVRSLAGHMDLWDPLDKNSF